MQIDSKSIIPFSIHDFQSESTISYYMLFDFSLWLKHAKRTKIIQITATYMQIISNFIYKIFSWATV